MNIPPRAANNYTTEQLLELSLELLDDARREQTDERMPIINNWLTNNFRKALHQCTTTPTGWGAYQSAQTTPDGQSRNFLRSSVSDFFHSICAMPWSQMKRPPRWFDTGALLAAKHQA